MWLEVYLWGSCDWTVIGMEMRVYWWAAMQEAALVLFLERAVRSDSRYTGRGANIAKNVKAERWTWLLHSSIWKKLQN